MDMFHPRCCYGCRCHFASSKGPKWHQGDAELDCQIREHISTELAAGRPVNIGYAALGFASLVYCKLASGRL